MNWDSFREYVKKGHSKRTVKDIVNYAKKYSNYLLNEDFSELNTFSVSKKRKVLVALSNLNKFLGTYETFKKLLKDYGLK